MKLGHRSFKMRWSGFACLLSWALVSGPASAGIPQPSVVYYGQARDAYGWPYTSGADVILRVGTNEIVRHAISGSLSPGVNFALHVPIDDGRDALNYVRYALTTGAVINIVVVDGHGERTIMESGSLPAIPRPGEFVRVNVTAAIDSDGDGIPDEWEWELILWAQDPAYATLADVRPQDDYDGDGVPNGDEYRAGTFPFLDYDYFYAEVFRKADNGRLFIQFLTVPGKVYRIESAPVLLVGDAFDWQSCEYALTETGALQEGPVEGSGNWMAFYVPPPATSRVWRLEVE